MPDNNFEKGLTSRWGGSIQERIGDDWWCFIVCEEPQICQLWEYGTCIGCQDFFQLPAKVQDELIYAIVLPKCCDDIVRAC
jgi:hypothetical protein